MIRYKNEQDFMSAAEMDGTGQLRGLLCAYPDATGFVLSTINIRGMLRPSVSTIGPNNKLRTLDDVEKRGSGPRSSVVGAIMLTPEFRKLLLESE